MVDYRAANLAEGFSADALIDKFNNVMNFGVVVIIILRNIAASFKLVYLGSAHTENHNVFCTDCVINLNIRAVHGSESYRAVNHKLHIARAACFRACKGNLLADVCGGHKRLRHGNIIVLHIDYLEPALNIGVIVNQLCNGTDEFNNFLCHIVARSRLCAENIGVRHKISVGICLDFKVFGKNIESIKMLALIFVKSLDLNIKNR